MNDKNNLKGQDCSGSRIQPPDPFNKTAESEGHVISDVQPDTDMSDLSFDRPDPDNQLTDFDYFPHSKGY